jgi:long-subunit acyl-CoA synthetase (AMP-forming)
LDSYQKISTIVVVKEAWSVENGCLTPTLKVKRNIVNQNYQNHLEGWHTASETIVFE